LGDKYLLNCGRFGERRVSGLLWVLSEGPIFLGSNLFFCPTPLLSDFGGKGMGALSQCLFMNLHRISGLFERNPRRVLIP